MGDIADDLYDEYVDEYFYSEPEYDVFHFILVHETPKAYLVKLPEYNDALHWFPKSQVRIFNNTIEVPMWLIKMKDIHNIDKMGDFDDEIIF